VPADRVRYAEQRRVPWWWWPVALAVAVPSIEVVAVFAPGGTADRGWLSAGVAFAATVAAVSAVLLALSRSRLRVDDQRLWVNGESLSASAMGRIRTLNAAQARLVLGRDAHVGARLSIKPWLHRAVQIEVVDPEDPVPYWVVATRKPEALAAVLRQLRDGDPGDVSGRDATATGDEADHGSGPARGRGATLRTGVEKGQR
jgi:hypothetical protein